MSTSFSAFAGCSVSDAPPPTMPTRKVPPRFGFVASGRAKAVPSPRIPGSVSAPAPIAPRRSSSARESPRCSSFDISDPPSQLRNPVRRTRPVDLLSDRVVGRQQPLLLRPHVGVLGSRHRRRRQAGGPAPQRLLDHPAVEREALGRLVPEARRGRAVRVALAEVPRLSLRGRLVEQLERRAPYLRLVRAELRC